MTWNKIDEQQIPLNTDVVIIDKLDNYWIGRFKFHQFKSIEGVDTYDIKLRVSILWEHLINVEKEILIEPEDVVYWIELPCSPYSATYITTPDGITREVTQEGYGIPRRMTPSGWEKE